MTNEIVIKETTQVATTNSVLDDMGISMSDVVLPRLMLMQNTSEAVGADKAKLGDIVSSLTEEVLGGVNAPISFIPLNTYKTWMVYEMSGATPRFVRTEACTKENEARPWDAMENGKPHRYNQVINCLALLRKDCSSEEAFPVVISFKRTSYMAGKILLTQILKQKILRRAVWSKAYLLTATKTKNDTNYYAILGVTPDSATTLAEQELAAMWSGVLAQSAYKVDDDKELRDEAPKVHTPEVVIVGNNGEDLPF